MSATSRSPKHRAPPRRRRFRLAALESLGFIDSPDTANIWTTSESHSAVAVAHPTGPPREDPFADWVPSEVVQKLVNSNFRWGFMAGILMIAMGLTGLAYWIYSQPAQAAEAAQNELLATARTLQPNIEAILTLDLATSDAQASEQLVDINSYARSLFDVAGTLPNTLSNERAIAADIAGPSLEGIRILNGAYAYRSAVVPILEIPAFEANPALVSPEDAASVFAVWQSRFEAVTGALPAGLMDQMGAELTLLSGDLPGLQTRYLDALRTDDPGAVALVLQQLAERLGNAKILLNAEFDDMASLARTQFSNATEAIDLLLS